MQLLVLQQEKQMKSTCKTFADGLIHITIFPIELMVLRNTFWLEEPAGWPALLEDGKQQHKRNQLLLRAWQA
jgi:hypothetical protein